MGNFKNVEELLNYMAVCEEPEPITAESTLNAYRLLQLACLEIRYYVEELMLDEQFFFDLIVPLEDLKVCNITDEDVSFELIRLPFGTFTTNVWNKLRDDKDNPVFKILEYFSFNVRGIHNILSMHGVDPKTIVTVELLNEHKIMDTYALHSYVGIFDNYSDFI